MAMKKKTVKSPVTKTAPNGNVMGRVGAMIKAMAHMGKPKTGSKMPFC